MTTRITRSLILLALLFPIGASAAGLPPWTLGMSKNDVTSQTQFGPYKQFSNGDLETFNGKFHGRKENIQFYFVNGRLRRIRVNLGEGTDTKKAIETFKRAYELLRQDYGKVEVPEMRPRGSETQTPPAVIAAGALANALVTGKTQMAPVRQPNGMFVFASLNCISNRKVTWFSVVINFDPPS
jgi:hypothetical protein